MASNGVFCLEGDWGALTDRTSVRLGLDMLMTVRRGRLIHRNAATLEEFEHYVNRWATAQYNGFPVAYFSFHGAPGTLSFARGDVSLDDIARAIKRPLTGRILYFASCSTLDLPAAELKRFVRQTGVAAIVGYTTDVGWEESAAFDFTLLPGLLGGTPLKTTYEQLAERHPYFVDGLGLRIATRSWAKPA
jgi:hypothetical protein